MNAKPMSVIALLLSCIFSLPALASEKPLSLANDHRIKVVAYDPNNVVTVVGSHLVATNIVFSLDESIISITNGDQMGWTIGVDKSTPYMLTVKPILPNSNTNLTVTTTKRQYVFNLMATPALSTKNVTYLLRFAYPEEDKAQLQMALRGVQHTLGATGTDPVSWNYNYSFHGAKTIAPVQAVDNGTFTIFKFPKNAPTPAIFAVDPQGHEALVNFRVQGDYVFVQGINRLYTLRNGSEVTSVYNDSYRVN